MLPGIQLNDMWLGTFHGLGKISFCFLIRKNLFFLANRFLRMHCKMVSLKNDFLIIDPDDQLSIVKRILKDEIKETNFYTDKPKAIVNFINKCKDEGQRSSDIILNHENRFKQLIYTKYEQYIQQENKLDFGELILLTKGFVFSSDWLFHIDFI
jgi:DNA helicase-2/ATP-dependent DNA helicase PcrA